MPASSKALAQSIIDTANTQPHVFKAFSLICEQIRAYGLDGTALSFNGGKDCTVLLHLVRAAVAAELDTEKLDKLQVIYFKSSSEFQEISDFMDDLSKEYGFQIVHVDGSYKEALTNLLASLPIKSIFMGQRRDDPGGTQLSELSPSDPGWPEFMRVNPLLDWTYEQIWDFLLGYKIPYCSLYDQGFTSLGSRYNTYPNPALKQPDGTFLPAYCLKDGSKERDGRYVRAESKSPTPPLPVSSSEPSSQTSASSASASLLSPSSLSSPASETNSDSLVSPQQKEA